MSTVINVKRKEMHTRQNPHRILISLILDINLFSIFLDVFPAYEKVSLGMLSMAQCQILNIIFLNSIKNFRVTNGTKLSEFESDCIFSIEVEH